MNIITPADLEQLLQNGSIQRAFEEQGHPFPLKGSEEGEAVRYDKN